MEKIKKWRIPLLIGFGVIQFFIIIGLIILNKNSDATKSEEEWLVTTHSEAESSSQESVESELIYWVVDVKGAVVKPGVYEVAKNMRIQDAIDLAGGLLPNAETRQLNFAQQLVDQMLIYVPSEGEEIAEIPPPPDSNQAETGGKVNINIANDLELQALPGIGEKKAIQIITYRTENGSFTTIEELMEVSGIGQKTFDSLKEHITVTK